MDELKKIAPKLSQINKENPYRVPYHYFDDFNARLQFRLKQEARESKPAGMVRYIRPIIGIAASLAIIFMLVYWPLSNSTKLAAQQEELPEFNIENAFIDLMHDLDDNALLTLFESEEEDESFSDEELLVYLSENLSDYDIYIESDK